MSDNPYMLRADATDDQILEHELSVEGGYDYDFFLDCSCGRTWRFTGVAAFEYLERLAFNHRGY